MANANTFSTWTESDHEKRASHDREELLALLDPVVASVLQDPSLWQPATHEIVTYLIHTCTQSPWFNHLALASVIYASSRVADPGHCVARVHRFLRWTIPKHYPDLASLQLEKGIAAYFGDPPESRGINLFKSYNALQIHVERFIAALSPEKRSALVSFLLPALPSSPALKRLSSRAAEKSRQRRKGKAFAVVNRLPELIALARRRYRWLAELDTRLQRVSESVHRGETQPPTLITQKSLENLSDVHFRVWDRASWVHAHQPPNSTKTIPQASTLNAPKRFFLQLVGELPENQWFLRAVACGALQGSQPPSVEARQYSDKWGVGKLDRVEAGLMTPDSAMAHTLHLARSTCAGTPEDSSVVFCLEPFLAAAAVGLFAVVSVVSTGMRIGELQQVTLDRECMVMLDLPEYDDQNAKWTKGPSRLYWRLYPKGSQKRERYLVTPYMNESMFLLLDLHKRFFGEHSVTSVHCGGLSQFSHARRFHGRYKFVLQWNGKHLSLQGLTKCVQFLLLEHICRDEKGEPIPMTIHLLRHGVAGWLCQKGFPLEDIMVLLKQVNITVTDYYSQRSPEHLHQKLGPAIAALSDLAGTDPALIRRVEDIRHLAQDALLRYGALRRTPGGYCGTFDPCMVHFACATCRFYVPDPRRRTDVAAKLILSDKIVTLRREAGDYIEADNEQVHHREWQRILKEMDALEQVPLVSPPPETVLHNLADDDLTDLLLPRSEEDFTLLSGGDESNVHAVIDQETTCPDHIQSTQPCRV